MRKIRYNTCAIIDSKAWFVSTDYYFMWMDLGTGETGYVFTEGVKRFDSVIDSMIVLNRSIYWVEQNGKRMLSYNLDTAICKEYSMEQIEMKNWVCFSLLTKWKDKIILVPKYTDKFVIFDTVKEEFTYIPGFFSKYINYSAEEYVNYAIEKDEYLYLFLGDDKSLLRYSLETEEILPIDRGDLKRNILSAYWKGGSLYVLDINGCIAETDYRFRIRKEFNLSLKKYDYCSLLVVNNSIILLPGLADDILVLDINSGNVEKLSYPEDMLYDEIQWGKYYSYNEQEKFILAPNRMSNYTLKISTDNISYTWIKPLPASTQNRIDYLRHKGDNIIEEDDLEFLLEYLHGQVK